MATVAIHFEPKPYRTIYCSVSGHYSYRRSSNGKGPNHSYRKHKYGHRYVLVNGLACSGTKISKQEKRNETKSYLHQRSTHAMMAFRVKLSIQRMKLSFGKQVRI